MDARSHEDQVRLARLEARRYQEEVEATVAEHAASTQTLHAVLADLGARGAELKVEMPDRELVGRVAHLGVGLVVIENLGGERFDLGLDAVGLVRQTKGAERPGPVSTGHPHTLQARLREALGGGERVSLSRRFGALVSGTIVGVSDSHVQGVDTHGLGFLIPLHMVTWITTL